MIRKIEQLNKHVRENKDVYFAIGVVIVMRMSNKPPKFQQFIVITETPNGKDS